MKYLLDIENPSSPEWDRTVEILRNGEILWKKAFAFGEDDLVVTLNATQPGDKIIVRKIVTGLSIKPNLSDQVEIIVPQLKREVKINFFRGAKYIEAQKFEGDIQIDA